MIPQRGRGLALFGRHVSGGPAEPIRQRAAGRQRGAGQVKIE